MKRSTFASVSRRATQLATFFLMATSVTFGGESVASDRENQLMGQMVVTAAAERPLIGHVVVAATREPTVLGHMLVAANRLAHASVLVVELGAMTVTAPVAASTVVADLGDMTVTAVRDAMLARNDAPKGNATSL